MLQLNLTVCASGRNPDDVKSRRKAEVDENKEMGLVFDTDPPMIKEAPVPKSKSRAVHRPKASVKSNSWFRMQASNNNAAEIYIYDEIGYWG